jgi:hypothetical protein
VSTSAQAPEGPSLLQNARAAFWIFVSLAGAACGITLLYLGMRSVMEIGGACADGGPFVVAQPCPKGVPLTILGGIWGAIIMVGIYVWQTIKNKVPSLVAFAWSALFLPLGWNFLEFGVNPPYGEGLVWGWLICAILFVIMGGLPLIFVVKPVVRSFLNPKAEPERVTPMGPRELKARLAAVTPTRSKASKKKASAQPPKTAWATLRDMDTTPKPAAAASDSGTEAEGMVAALERLQYLHKSGSLTAEEFAAAKARIIEGES